MIHIDILQKVLDVYEKVNIKSFPIHCFELLDKLQIEYIDYNTLSKKKQIVCKQMSDDAFIFNNIIYYNGTQAPMRLRFSLMHELGHIILNHSVNRNDFEEHEANFFASNLLAPRIAIHYAQCNNVKDIVRIFLLSKQAAEIALSDHIQNINERHYDNLSEPELYLYMHFYNNRYKKFVYKIGMCQLCEAESYNYDAYCPNCKRFFNGLSCRNAKNYDIYSQEII